MNDTTPDSERTSVPPQKASFVKRLWFKRTLLVLMSLCFSMCAVEVAFRLKSPLGHEAMLFGAPDFSHPDLYVADQDLLLVPQPGFKGEVQTIEYTASVRINSQGVRGGEIPEALPEELRLLAVGDSFTMAVQVPEAKTYVALLERQLSEDLGRPVRIINAGVDGFGTQQSTLYARRLGSLYDVDGAILLFFTGNDFWENDSYQRRRPNLRGELMPTPKPYLSFWDKTLGRYSYAYAYVRVHWRTRAMRNNAHQIRRYKDELQIFDQKSPSLQNQMRTTQGALKGFATLCSEQQWACFMPIAPPAFVADTKRAAATFRLVDMSMENIDLDRPANALLAERIEGLPMFDLSPALRESKKAAYFRFDGHWTPAGHRVVADTLADWLTPYLRALPR